MNPMFNKQKLRKKAMDMVMKGGPSMAIAIKKKPMMAKMGKPVMDNSMSQFMDNDAQEQMGEHPKNESEAQGLVQMEVSPKEQEMILAMREQGGEESEKMPEEGVEVAIKQKKMMA